MIKTEAVSACTSYVTCTLVYLQNLDWATVGAVILLAARLIKDVPDAYDAIKIRLKADATQNKKKLKKKKRNVKSNR